MSIKEKTIVLYPWLISLAYTVYYLLAEKNVDFLYLFIGLYTLLLGSFVYLRIPDHPSALKFLQLTSIMALMFLFLYSSISWLNLVGLFFLCVCPLSLYLFLYSFIQSENRILFKKSIVILFFVSVYCYVAFLLKFFPEQHLFLLLIVSTIISCTTIYRERKLFFSSLQFEILSISILCAFLPFILCYSVPIIFSFDPNGNSNAALLVILFPTCIAYTLISNKTIIISRRIFLHILLFFLSICFFLFINLLNLSFMEKILITACFILFCYLSHFSIYLLQRLEETRVKGGLETLNNEKIEILNQVTYSQFFNSVANLLLNRLKDETKSPTILMLLKSEKKLFILCQYGRKILKSVKKIIIVSPSSKQLIEIEGLPFYFLSVSNSEETVFVFFERTEHPVDLEKIEEIMQQYKVILKTVNLIYASHQKYIDSSLNTTQLLQMKLFNSLEKEKKRYTNYLHDNILQSIIGLHTLVSSLHGDDEVMGLVRIEFSKLVQSIRKEIFNTSPSTLYHLSFEENIQILMDDFNQKYPQIKFIFHAQLKESFPKYLIAPVYRIIKELNENVGKHSKAAIGETNIITHKNIFSIVVEDNGIGINDYSRVEKKLIQSKEHMGLLSIKNDVNWLNGSFELLSVPNLTAGTTIRITIPFESGEEI